MPKIVINAQAGGFGLSPKGIAFYASLKKMNMEVYINIDSDYQSYKIFRQKIGEETAEYLLMHCVLPSGEAFPEEVDNNFIFTHRMPLNDYDHIQIDGGVEGLKVFRSSPELVQTVEAMEDLCFGESSVLKVVDVPDDVIWEIYHTESGREYIREVSRIWQ